jgi:serine/threonine protein kinase
MYGPFPVVAKFAYSRGSAGETHAAWARECQLLKAAQSPYVIQLFDFFIHNGVHWMIMEQAQYSLQKHIETVGCLSDRDTAAVGLQILAGLHSLSVLNIVHRDLHIENILWVPSLIDNARAKIGDFGLAKLLAAGDVPAASQAGRFYEVAPEFLVTRQLTPLSDLYQLGLVMYFVRTGKMALSEVDGTAPAAIMSGMAGQRAAKLGFPLGHFIASLLRRRYWFRPSSARNAAWELTQIHRLLSDSHSPAA